MSDPITLAKTAREALAKALNALQSDPSVPAEVVAVAEPVAKAMGALHAIERSAPEPNLSTAPAARDHVRAALGTLQTQDVNHPVVMAAMEAVAGSLGMVFQLAKMAESTAAAPTQLAPQMAAPAPQAPAAQAAPAYAPAPAHAPAPGHVAAPVPAHVAAPVPAYGSAPVPAQAGPGDTSGTSPWNAQSPAPAPWQQAQAPVSAPVAPAAGVNPYAQPQPYQAPAAAPAQTPYQAPAPAPHQAPAAAAPYVAPVSPPAADPFPAPAPAYQAPAQAQAPAAYQAPAPAPYVAPQPAYVAPAPAAAPAAAAPVAAASAPAASPASFDDGLPPMGPVAIRIDASLGTNSESNFYKGLSGNDIIEHGGLFVATFKQIPKRGTEVSLHVTLPGGYEFDAMAVVAWTRDRSESAVSGFGVKFTKISPESRQLIYRYVRLREPLFYDDL